MVIWLLEHFRFLYFLLKCFSCCMVLPNRLPSKGAIREPGASECLLGFGRLLAELAAVAPVRNVVYIAKKAVIYLLVSSLASLASGRPNALDDSPNVNKRPLLAGHRDSLINHLPSDKYRPDAIGRYGRRFRTQKMQTPVGSLCSAKCRISSL